MRSLDPLDEIAAEINRDDDIEMQRNRHSVKYDERNAPSP